MRKKQLSNLRGAFFPLQHYAFHTLTETLFRFKFTHTHIYISATYIFCWYTLLIFWLEFASLLAVIENDWSTDSSGRRRHAAAAVFCICGGVFQRLRRASSAAKPSSVETRASAGHLRCPAPQRADSPLPAAGKCQEIPSSLSPREARGLLPSLLLLHTLPTRATRSRRCHLRRSALPRLPIQIAEVYSHKPRDQGDESDVSGADLAGIRRHDQGGEP